MRARAGARGCGAAVAALLIGVRAAPAQQPALTLHTTAREIRITPSYQGELVRVRGTAPAGADVVVELSSAGEPVRCSRKGKVGPFWLSVGTVRFENVPGMFKVKSTAPLDDILPEAQQVRYRLGRAGLAASVRVVPDSDRDVYLDELIRIRERERLFGFAEGAVRRDGDRYQASFFWPPDGPPGDYRVAAFAVARGTVLDTVEAVVAVRAVGLEAWVRALARDHGFLYGLFAVGLAVVTGLAACLLFAAVPGPGRPAAGAGDVSGPAAG